MKPRQRIYLDALRSAVPQAAVTTIWVAAGELPALGRRRVRLGMALAMAAAGFVRPKDTPTVEIAAPPPASHSPGAEAGVNLGRVVLAAVLVPTLAVAPVVARRRLERRWLERLRRNGHPHPHRAVAVRFGLIALIGTLVSSLTKAYDREHGGDAEPLTEQRPTLAGLPPTPPD